MSHVDRLLAEARADLTRVGPAAALALVTAGGVLVDIRPIAQRSQDGELPDAWIVDRNVLEWRLDPTSPDRLEQVDESFYERPVIVVCNAGYASSLAAATLRQLGLAGATDLDGGFEAWVAEGLPVV